MGVTQRFGPYELVRRLGSGGMAETFLAVRRGPGEFVQHVCVKRILPAFEGDASFVAQFLEEARLAAQLRHASIAQVVDFGEVEGSHYLALELVDGVDLRALLAKLRERGETLPVPLAVHVGLQVAGALDFAHTPGRKRAPVIHRDISPSNVLISRAGEVYLTDFGIARAVGAKRQTESGVVRGKVPYLAPEYARTGEYDARTDLFSLGVVLFEALAGRRPFDGKTDLDTLQRIQEGRRPGLTELAPATPAPLVTAIDRLLNADPHARFESASKLIDALAPLAPPPTIARELGAIVRSIGESLSASLQVPLSGSTDRTAPRPGAAAPSFPEVESSPADAETRTSSPAALAHTQRAPSGTESLWSATDPTSLPATSGRWSSTDASRISQHDRPAPGERSLASTLPLQDAGAGAPTPGSWPAAGAVEGSAAGSWPAVGAPPGPGPGTGPGTGTGAGAGPGPGTGRGPAAGTGSGPTSRPGVAASGRRRGWLVGLVLAGLLVFALATAGTYAVVLVLRGGA